VGSPNLIPGVRNEGEHIYTMRLPPRCFLVNRPDWKVYPLAFLGSLRFAGDTDADVFYRPGRRRHNLVPGDRPSSPPRFL